MCISSVKRNNTSFWFFCFLFVLLVFLLRFEVPPEMSKDFIAYSKIPDLHNTGFSVLFIEPYRYFIYKIASLFFDKDENIVLFVYYFNLSINSVFFIWVAKLYDIPIWRKTLLFSLFFIVFSFVWLRASVAYIILGYFFYHAYRGENKLIGYFSLFVHLSSLPVIYLWVVKYVRKQFKLLMVVLLVIMSFVFFSSDYSSYVIYKIGYYVESGAEKENLKHQLYFFFFSCFFIGYLFFHKARLKDNFLLLLYMFYVLVFFINVVAAQRISHFLLIAILFLPIVKTKKVLFFRKKMAYISFCFIFIFYFKFYSVIAFESL